MNTENLKKLRNFLDRERDTIHFDMRNYVVPVDEFGVISEVNNDYNPASKKDANFCNTACCITGAAAILSLQEEGETITIRKLDRSARIMAEYWLGLSGRQGDDMFIPDSNLRAITLDEAIDMLDRAIETDKIVWKKLPSKADQDAHEALTRDLIV